MGTFILYKHTCPNNKCYIGITSYKNPNQRWRNGLGYYNDNELIHTKWGNAIIKYGWDNIKHEILYKNLNKEEACELEKKYIKYYKELGLSYNLTDGGDGIWGYKFTIEQKRNLSESHKGLKQSEDTIKKRVQKNIGKHRTDETKKKKSIPVIQYTLNDEYVNEYFGVREATRNTGILHINEVCNGFRKSAGGYKWKWKDINHENFKKVSNKLHNCKEII